MKQKKFLLTAVLICSLVLSLGMSVLALENDAAAPATDLQIGNNTEELSGDENSSAAGSDLTSEQTRTDSKEKKKIAASSNFVSPKTESTVTIDSIDYEVDAESGTATVTGGKPTDGVFHIPAKITTVGATYRVTAIAEKAFVNYSGDDTPFRFLKDTSPSAPMLSTGRLYRER